MTEKLELSRLTAYRCYRTARKTILEDGIIRKEPKGKKETSTAVKVSVTQLNDNPTGAKGHVTPMLPMTSRNAMSGAVNNDGLSGALVTLRNLEKVDGKFRRILPIIYDVETLKYAYSLIKSKPGNLTPGHDPETLDGIDNE